MTSFDLVWVTAAPTRTPRSASNGVTTLPPPWRDANDNVKYGPNSTGPDATALLDVTPPGYVAPAMSDFLDGYARGHHDGYDRGWREGWQQGHAAALSALSEFDQATREPIMRRTWEEAVAARIAEMESCAAALREQLAKTRRAL